MKNSKGGITFNFARVAELVDATDLSIIERLIGNSENAIPQIRGNLTGDAVGNPEPSSLIGEGVETRRGTP